MGVCHCLGSVAICYWSWSGRKLNKKVRLGCLSILFFPLFFFLFEIGLKKMGIRDEQKKKEEYRNDMING